MLKRAQEMFTVAWRQRQGNVIATDAYNHYLCDKKCSVSAVIMDPGQK